MPAGKPKLVCRDVPSDVWDLWHRQLRWVTVTTLQFGPFVIVDYYHPGMN